MCSLTIYVFADESFPERLKGAYEKAEATVIRKEEDLTW